MSSSGGFPVRLVTVGDLDDSQVTVVEETPHGSVAVGVSGGMPFAVSNRCRHLFASLGKGHVTDDGCLECPRHAALYDVGTGKNDKSERMGTQYDTPTLLAIYRGAPYLHDGSAVTLREVLTTKNTEDRHGRTSQLTKPEIDDLVQYLLTL